MGHFQLLPLLGGLLALIPSTLAMPAPFLLENPQPGTPAAARDSSDVVMARSYSDSDTGLVYDPSSFTLSSSWDVNEEPTTRTFDFEMHYVEGAPDGYFRRMAVVNGQYPGPLIEANEGDTIVVNLLNNLDVGQTIHWHGMHQNGSQWMDGVPGFSQCVIPPGQSFTYEFKVENQYGSYWWHSHYSNTLADGLVGALIIHSPDDPLVRGRDFDEERVLYVSDWQHDESQTIVNDLLRYGQYNGSPAPPEGDSELINGRGQANCTGAPEKSNCRRRGPPTIDVPVNKRIRFRVINTGAHAMYRLSLDEHLFEVVEVDDTPVYGPADLHEFPIGPGERYSIIIDTNQGQVGDSFWLRSSAALNCIGLQTPKIGRAVVRYVDEDGNGGCEEEPKTKPWPDLANPVTEICYDLDHYYTLTPRVGENAPTEILHTAIMSSQLGQFINTTGQPFGGFGFNNVTYKNQINSPLLSDIESGRTLDPTLVASATFTSIGGGDIIINNLDGNIAHPYHLHGRSFYLVGRGSGNITAEDVQGMQLNTTNPLRKDTLFIPDASWAILRLVTDTPGVWPLHCHIGWHLAEGKMAAIVIQPETIQQFARPTPWANLCAGTDPSAFGPAKRRSLSQSRSRLSLGQ